MDKVISKMRDIESNSISAEELAMSITDEIVNNEELTDAE